MNDFLVIGNPRETITLIRPITGIAKAWVEDHIDADTQWLGKAFAVECRYVRPLLDGILGDGMTYDVIP